VATFFSGSETVKGERSNSWGYFYDIAVLRQLAGNSSSPGDLYRE